MKPQKLLRKAALKRETEHQWKQWLASEGAPLSKFGLPKEVLIDEDHWCDFCTHGRLHMHPHLIKFSVDDIQGADAQHLLDFLEKLLIPEEKACSALYRVLLHRIHPDCEDYHIGDAGSL